MSNSIRTRWAIFYKGYIFALTTYPSFRALSNEELRAHYIYCAKDALKFIRYGVDSRRAWRLLGEAAGVLDLLNGADEAVISNKILTGKLMRRLLK